jgi:D-threonate/D-erythronate kinase
MQTIRILADDLTGALDSAGCFAGAGRDMPVVFDAAHLPNTGGCAVSTDSRDVTESEAVERIERFGAVFDNRDGIAFKKIDSLLRGHVAAEIAHLMRRGGFDAAVIAPAFPALDRVTRRGRQWAKLAGDDVPRIVGPDLASDFARLGVDLRPGVPGSAQSRSAQIFLADAQTEDDLKAVVDQGRRAGRVLWCGCAGLAEILADARPEPATLAAPRMLVLCGTRHPVASLQLAKLGGKDESAIVALRPGHDADRAAGSVNERLRGGTWAGLVADFPYMAPDDARVMLGRAAQDILRKLDRPDALLVMGGDTLQMCCEALGAHRLSVRGLLAPGIAVSEFSDGEWASLTVISKSGAFGAADTLSDIVAKASGERAASDAGSPQNRPRQKVPSH